VESNPAESALDASFRSLTNDFSASRQESSLPAIFPPPSSVTQLDQGLSRSPFFFLFQRGLADATGLLRLAKGHKLVSEGPTSLSDRPSPETQRFKNVLYFQWVAVSTKPACSELNLVAETDANPRYG
jgi:hypothetical protein